MLNTWTILQKFTITPNYTKSVCASCHFLLCYCQRSHVIAHTYLLVCRVQRWRLLPTAAFIWETSSLIIIKPFSSLFLSRSTRWLYFLVKDRHSCSVSVICVKNWRIIRGWSPRSNIGRWLACDFIVSYYTRCTIMHTRIIVLSWADKEGFMCLCTYN